MICMCGVNDSRFPSLHFSRALYRYITERSHKVLSVNGYVVQILQVERVITGAMLS
jgi:hypothetical protein